MYVRLAVYVENHEGAHMFILAVRLGKVFGLLTRCFFYFMRKVRCCFNENSFHFV